MDSKLEHFALISDIHSNYEALVAVLTEIERRGIPRVVCLGDIVGYGPQPKECIDLIRKTCSLSIRGNHDDALFTRPTEWNQWALKAIDWTRKTLSDKSDPENEARLDWLSNLRFALRKDGMTFVHGSPIDPINGYLSHADVYKGSKTKMTNTIAEVDDICFVGHTHLPSLITAHAQYMEPEKFGFIYDFENVKIIVNVGSVGQPRDGNPEASFVEFDNPRVYFHRVPYDISATYEKIKAIKDLDIFLAERLLSGE